VRFAILGLFEELIASPEIWYCLTCRRCSKVCPNLVKPETIVGYARAASVRCGAVSYNAARPITICSGGSSGCAGMPCITVCTATMSRSAMSSGIPGSKHRSGVHGRRHLQRIFKTNEPFRQAAKAQTYRNVSPAANAAAPAGGRRAQCVRRFIFRMVNLDWPKNY